MILYLSNDVFASCSWPHSEINLHCYQWISYVWALCTFSMQRDPQNSQSPRPNEIYLGTVVKLYECECCTEAALSSEACSSGHRRALQVGNITNPQAGIFAGILTALQRIWCQAGLCWPQAWRWASSEWVSSTHLTAVGGSASRSWFSRPSSSFWPLRLLYSLLRRAIKTDGWGQALCNGDYHSSR